MIWANCASNTCALGAALLMMKASLQVPRMPSVFHSPVRSSVYWSLSTLTSTCPLGGDCSLARAVMSSASE